MEVEDRKSDHLSICLNREVEARNETTWLEYVYLIHQALPELNFKEIDVTTSFLGHKFSAPLLIDCMTGGPKLTYEINRNLAGIANELGIGMGVGSQRAVLVNPELAKSFSVVRDVAPDIFVMANIGGPQLSKGLSMKEINMMVEMVRANALVVHLNPLQELIQVEGEPYYREVLKAIEKLANELSVPIIVKEVGCGISREVALKLEMVGVKAINVAGLGGTSWAGVEAIRAEELNVMDKAELGRLFWDWGIPTAASILEVRSITNLPLIASGGIRNGLQVAKSLALGADMTAIALPIIRRVVKFGKDEALKYLKAVILQLKTALFLTGSKDVHEIKKKRYVLTGKLKEWAENLGGL